MPLTLGPALAPGPPPAGGRASTRDGDPVKVPLKRRPPDPRAPPSGLPGPLGRGISRRTQRERKLLFEKRKCGDLRGTPEGFSTLTRRLLECQTEPREISCQVPHWVARTGDQALAGPLGSLDAYLERVSRIAVLTRDEERALAERFRSAGDLDAARQLVLSHLRFVVHIARGYSGYGLPVGDLIQEGNVGLMKAVKRFDPSLNVRLVSFAVHWIAPRSTSMCCATGVW